MFSVGAAGIQSSLQVSYQGLVGALLFVPAVVSLILEPALFLLADRRPRRGFVVGGLATMAVAALGCALAPSVEALAVALAVSGVAGACGVELAQATLVDAHPEARERVLARWAFLGGVGDLAAPALLAVLAGLGLGWRAGFAVMAGALAVWAALVARAPFPTAGAAAEPEADAGPPVGIRAALTERRLLAWLLAVTLCDLLDELLVILASVHLRDQLGASAAARSLALGGFVVGGLVGLALVERWLGQVPPRRLVAGSALACAAALAAWLAAPTLWLAALGLALVGATAAPLYPLTMAQAYAALPGRSGAVHAVARVFAPLALATPWLLAWLADRAGTSAALAAAALGPVAIALVALRDGVRRHRS